MIKATSEWVTFKCSCNCGVIYPDWVIKVIPYKTYKDNKKRENDASKTHATRGSLQ